MGKVAKRDSITEILHIWIRIWSPEFLLHSTRCLKLCCTAGPHPVEIWVVQSDMFSARLESTLNFKQKYTPTDAQVYCAHRQRFCCFCLFFHLLNRFGCFCLFFHLPNRFCCFCLLFHLLNRFGCFWKTYYSICQIDFVVFVYYFIC